MLKTVLGLFVLCGAVAFLSSSSAQEKKDDKKTLEGKMVCSKCKLSETADCGNAILVKEKDKEVTYYLKDKGKAETYHKCTGEKEVKVTGKITEKDGKKYVEDAKVEDKK